MSALIPTLNSSDTARLKQAIDIYSHLHQFSKEYSSSILHLSGVVCSICGTGPIQTSYYICMDCSATFICSQCEPGNKHDRSHLLYKMSVKLPNLFSLYEHNISPWQSKANRKFRAENTLKFLLPYSYHRLLVKNSPMPISESEALYEVFKCLVTNPVNSPFFESEIDESHSPLGEESGLFSGSWLSGVRSFSITISELSSRLFGVFQSNNLPVIEDEVEETWGGISKQSLCELFPSVYNSDSFLENFFFAIYDQNDDGFVDFEEFVKAHICLTYTSDIEKVALAVRLLALAEHDKDTETYKFRPSQYNVKSSDIMVCLEQFLDVLRRLLYSYYDLSKFIFADASQLLYQQLTDETGFEPQKVSPSSRLRSDIDVLMPGQAASEKVFLDPWVWPTNEANRTDTRMNYNPISDDMEVDGNVSNFHLERVEESIMEFRNQLSDLTLTSLVSAQRITGKLSKTPAISSAMIACIEASLV